MRALTGVAAYLFDKILTVGVLVGLIALFVAYPVATAILVTGTAIAIAASDKD